MADDAGDPVPEEPASELQAPAPAPAPAPPKLTKEQIAAVSADIAAVTKTMQEQLQAISAEVNALKGEIDGQAEGGIKRELDQLREQASALDGRRGGGGQRRGEPPRLAGGSRAAASEPRRRRGNGDDGLGRPRDSRAVRESRERPGASWKMGVLLALALLLWGPLRHAVKIALQRWLGEADAPEYEF
eukprot:COSAG04_NODE_204_length_20429_cov_6.166896_4_plen_188_part_00